MHEKHLQGQKGNGQRLTAALPIVPAGKSRGMRGQPACASGADHLLVLPLFFNSYTGGFEPKNSKPQNHGLFVGVGRQDWDTARSGEIRTLHRQAGTLWWLGQELCSSCQREEPRQSRQCRGTPRAGPACCWGAGVTKDTSRQPCGWVLGWGLLEHRHSERAVSGSGPAHLSAPVVRLWCVGEASGTGSVLASHPKDMQCPQDGTQTVPSSSSCLPAPAASAVWFGALHWESPGDPHDLPH